MISSRPSSFNFVAHIGLFAALVCAHAFADEGLIAKQYSPGASGKNRAVVLTVPSFTVTDQIGGTKAPNDRRFLIIDTRWQNILPLQPQPASGGGGAADSILGGLGGSRNSRAAGSGKLVPVPYVIPDFPDHLFVLINGDMQSTLNEATASAPHPLSIEKLEVSAPSAPVEGNVAFEIPARDVTSIELEYLDSDYGAMRLPLFGKAPPPSKPLAAAVHNDVVELTALRFRETPAVAGVQASAGHEYAIVDVDLRGMSENNLVRLEAARYSTLGDAEGFTYLPVPIDGLPGEFSGVTQLLPAIPQRGSIAFLVPASHSALTFAMNFPDLPSLKVAIPGSGPSSPPTPVALMTIDDGEILSLKVYDAHSSNSLGDKRPGAGNRYVVIDVGFASKSDQGIDFQTSAQLMLLDGDNKISVDADALDALPHPLIEDSIIPPHGQGRYEVVYQVPAATNSVVLYYRGFVSEARRPLKISPKAAR
jgi:hypothetical protein